MVKEEARGFAVSLHEMGNGALIQELTEKQFDLLNALAAKAEADGGTPTGELTLKIKYKVDKKGLVHVDPKVTVKKPEAAQAQSVFWLTAGGNLTARNPKQMDLPVRGVPEARERDAGEDRRAARDA